MPVHTRLFLRLTFNKITHKRLCVTLLPGQYVPRSFLFLMEVLTHAFSYKIIFKTLTFNKITHKHLCVTPLPGQYIPRSFLILMEVLTHAFSYKIIFKTDF